MASRERIYQRELRRVVDEEVRRAIEAMFERRRKEVPVPLELRWSGDGEGFRIETPFASFVIAYTAEVLTVDAELSWAARLMATARHRDEMVRAIEQMAEELGL
jgi:hypothetical protein